MRFWLRLFALFVQAAWLFSPAFAFQEEEQPAKPKEASSNELRPTEERPKGEKPKSAEEPRPEKPAAPASEVPKEKPAIGPADTQQGDLDTFLLRDSKGNLVPVLGMSFEEFERLLKLRQGLAPAAPPPYTLDGLAVTGKLEQGAARLDVVATIRVRDEGWVRVPLKMGKAVLREVPKHEGPGEQFTTFDAADGYLCWLKGADARPHVVRLSIVAPVSEVGAESRLEIALPRGTESSFKLEVPVDKIEASLKSGSDGLLTAKSLGAGKSEIQVLGGGGELQFSWRAAQAMTSAAKQLLDASGDVTVRVEGRSRVSSEARLKVRSFGGGLQSFRVKLPAGMEWVPTNPTGYTVTVVDPPAGGMAPGAGAKPQTLEVRLDRENSGVVEVRLLAALSPAVESARPAALEPARFEVVDAVRQRGTIDFVVEGDWFLQFTEDASTRRVDVPPDAASTLKSQARFEYFRQPCGLKVQVATRPTRVVVEPTYIVYVEPKVLRLEATLKYRVRGTRPAHVGLALAGWQFDRASPDSLIETESLDPAASPLMLPLRMGTAGELEIKLELHRELPPGDHLEFDFPRPVADLVDPATVAVLAADNVELTLRPREVTGLTTETFSSALQLPARQQPPLMFRDLGAASPSHFSADFQVRTRQITAGAEAELTFSRAEVSVVQRIRYRILYEAERRFTLLVPEAIAARGEIKVLLGTEVLPLVPAESVGSVSGPGTARYQVTTPAGQIGPTDLRIEYSAPLPELEQKKNVEVSVPLVVPADEEIQSTMGQTLAASWNDSLRVELATSAGPAGLQPLAEPSAPLALKASSPRLLTVSKWNVALSDPSAGGSVVVHKFWLQTVIGAESRQDRAVWKLRTSAREVALRLPVGAAQESVQIAVDGEPVPSKFERETAIVRIPVPSKAQGQDAVFEAWYSVGRDSSSSRTAHLSLAAPALQGMSYARAVFWQVCLPADQHLVLDPPGFVSEMKWNWQDWFWDRRGVKSQKELEEWSGASPQEPLPRATNQYLYSARGAPQTLAVWTVPRSYILWSAGGFVLALGMLVLHVRWVRHPSVLLLVAVAIAALGLSWPSAALLVAQAASIGLAIAGLAAFWQWMVVGRPTWPRDTAAPASTARERKSTAAQVIREPLAPPSTATAPLAGATEARP